MPRQQTQSADKLRQVAEAALNEDMDNLNNSDPDSQVSLYSDTDPVHVLKDDGFFFDDGKAKIRNFAGAGVLKAYAPWCPHCVSKVTCINVLAEILKEDDLAVYVINAENNPHFSRNVAVAGYPTFFEVNSNGIVGAQLKTPDGGPVGSVPDIVIALCGNQSGMCDLKNHLEALHGKGC
jgi:thiol-disulfide isomerase/thioredoxin